MAPSANLGRSLLYLIDRPLALVLLVAALPIIVVVSTAVLVFSKKNPFIRHRRAGRFGTRLDVIKIRTMWGEFKTLESGDSSQPKTIHDPRVTSTLAIFCRKYSIDELPQLFQVVTGKMSLVGPRPLTEQELAAHYESARTEVLSVRPGISGLWQVKGRNRLTYSQRRRFDVFLTRHYSASLYFRILFATIGSVLSGRDAW